MNDELLAKDSGETLFEHTMAVVNAIRQVVANLPDGVFDQQGIVDELVLCAAFHDVGKAAVGFQEVLRHQRPKWDGKRHEVLSAAFSAHYSGLSEEAHLAILTHHRTLPPDGNAGREAGAIPSEQMPDPENVIWFQMVNEWETNRALFQEFWRKVCQAINHPELIELGNRSLEKFGLASPWLSQSPNNRRGQLKVIPFERRAKAALYRGLLITSDHMASGKTTPVQFPDLSKVKVYNGKLRNFQKRCQITEQNAILRAPTGSGKTEASLLWMQANWRKNSRVFYVLPYTASINAMHKRLSGIFGTQLVNVLHSKASAYLYSLLPDDKLSLDAQSKASALASLAREMYFPIRICTPHQILRYALRGRGWEQMLAEFPQACFIFDEIHAYDAQMTGLILGAAKMAMKWDARLLFATATMPEFLKRLIQDTIGIPEENVIEPKRRNPTDRRVLDKKRHWIEIWNGSLVTRLDEILQTTYDCPHTLIVCNHVRTAQQVFERCWQKFGKDAVLLHSRFAQKDRNKIEQDLLVALPRILVATQVVEVSLNIDFYQAFFDPAPIDATAQRMGRVNRYGSRPPAQVVVMNEQTSSHKLYDVERSRRTVEALRTAKNPISEDELVILANYVYADGFQGEELLEFETAFHHPSFERLEDHLIAGVHREWTDEIFDDADGRMEVLPAFYENKYRQLMSEGKWLEAISLLVPLRTSMVIAMKNDPKHWRSIDSSDEPWVIHKPYDAIRGLRLDTDNDETD